MDQIEKRSCVCRSHSSLRHCMALRTYLQSCCDCCLTGKWSIWSWRWMAIAAINGKRSRLRRPKNGVPQWSVLAPLLFNIYISDLPTTVSRKYAYADDLAIMHADGDWQGVLNKHTTTIGEYLQTWKLKLSTTKAVSAAFHLNNKEAKRGMKVNFNNEILSFCSKPKYLGVTLDRSLTYPVTLSHFARSWHHVSHSWGGLLVPVGVLEQ